MATRPTGPTEDPAARDTAPSRTRATTPAAGGEPLTAYQNWNADCAPLGLDACDPGTEYLRTGAAAAAEGGRQEGGGVAALDQAAAALIAEIEAGQDLMGVPGTYPAADTTAVREGSETSGAR